MKIIINIKCGECQHHGYCKYEDDCKKYSGKNLDTMKSELSTNMIVTIECEGFERRVTKVFSNMR